MCHFSFVLSPSLESSVVGPDVEAVCGHLTFVAEPSSAVEGIGDGVMIDIFLKVKFCLN